MRQIAIYGKGGIGKSTTTQNVAAALAEAGKKVLLIGCDPKADSTRLILGHKVKNTVLDVFVKLGDHIERGDIMHRGFLDIDCVESGGPEAGSGCAGKGISLALKVLTNLGIYEEDYDFILYDVLGDVVCGGFSTPMRESRAKEIYIVCSGESMSLYAANNICKGISRFAKSNGTCTGGLICNSRNVQSEMEIAGHFAEQTNIGNVNYIPRDNIVHKAELVRKTVIEYDPACNQAGVYRELAQFIINNEILTVPQPMSDEKYDEFEEFAASLQ